VTKYYLGAIDPDGGPYCAPARGPRRKLQLAGAKHLVDLAPSHGLFESYQACLAVRAALATGELPDRTFRKLKAWATNPTRKLQSELMLEFLHGKTLEEADSRFEETYTRELTSPQAWAALTWIAFEPEAELCGDVELAGAIVRRAVDSPIGPLRGSSSSGSST
jgi:hypothetical protein